MSIDGYDWSTCLLSSLILSKILLADFEKIASSWVLMSELNCLGEYLAGVRSGSLSIYRRDALCL